MKKETKKIYIQWEGPFKSNKLSEFDNQKKDYGLYQIYGDHVLYGRNVLLYIGLTKGLTQTFAMRVTQKNKDTWTNWEDLKIYLGRFCGIEEVKNNQDWDSQIDFAEALLINYLTPAWNSDGLNGSKPLGNYDECKVINIGNRMSIPEIMIKGNWACNGVLDYYDKALIYDKNGADLKIYESD
jgi:hypothetical protein